MRTWDLALKKRRRVHVHELVFKHEAYVVSAKVCNHYAEAVVVILKKSFSAS